MCAVLYLSVRLSRGEGERNRTGVGGPRRSVCLRWRCLCVQQHSSCFFFFCSAVCTDVCLCVRTSLAVRGLPSSGGGVEWREGRREGTAVADHYRQGGAASSAGFVYGSGRVLNERCSISLIMPPLRLMSLFSDSKVCKKASLLSGLFAFLIGLNKRGRLSSCRAGPDGIVLEPPLPLSLYVCFLHAAPVRLCFVLVWFF